MCLGEICQVVGLEEGGRLRVRGNVREQVVSPMTLDRNANVGDWVVVHSGFALGWLDPEEAREALALRATTPDPWSPAIDSAPAVPAPAHVRGAGHRPTFSPSEIPS
jgi:hydrogenase expression/formation protein HypC